ncbi:long-chain fatty acid--CoA ligase [Bowmanella pacifica]|uniref:Long-chain-fatty-acid--CoA ligase n=1 Tax=Bowmanella pacifica TaxID=502051 RepID=A0A917Z3S8_9ALTE|nr:long-chain fatty acid--CoA ligase [Bowmanella pacifica]GGO74307.1 long-chain-fatty-acid--CoA ligase [Bowmanella pacifica]
MLNLVPNKPLNVSDILLHMRRVHAGQQVVSVGADGTIHHTSYENVTDRVAQLANALKGLGVQVGDCLSTLAWNDQRHLEIYFAVPGLGAICHTVNPRLFSEQLAYILKDANSQWLFVDPMFVPLITPLLGGLPALKGIIVLGGASQLDPAWAALGNGIQWYDYESLLSGHARQFDWPVLDENTPCGCCYTSGTTGDPKGVLYSHRSTVLHSLAIALPDSAGLSATDSALIVVPMFHVNAWGLPYSGAMVGAKMVLPGRFMGDGAMLAKLIAQEQVTLAAGVPTVLQAWVNHQSTPVDNDLRVIVGGAACTESLRAGLEALGCEVRPAWGMTETSPIGTVNRAGTDEHRLSPGQAVFGVELRIIDDQGQPLAHDGEQSGELQIRGPWIVSGYIGKPGAEAFNEDGWFSTGDIARLYPDGYMHITDRAKDLIKSGGEWISSLALEEIASRHQEVTTAAVIAMPHPQWDERPLLLVVVKDPQNVDEQTLLDWFDGKVAKWWKPDAVRFVDALPLTATGKIDKKKLRSLYTESD